MGLINVEKMLGSETKSDILKYLIFRRQGVAMRSLEAETGWTFPSISKQITSLESAGLISVDKSIKNKRSIFLNPDVLPILKSLYLFALEQEFKALIQSYDDLVQTYYLGHVFGFDIEPDFVLIYHNISQEKLATLLEKLSILFRKYKIEPVK